MSKAESIARDWYGNSHVGGLQESVATLIVYLVRILGYDDSSVVYELRRRISVLPQSELIELYKCFLEAMQED